MDGERKDRFLTSLAVKAFLQRPDGSVLLLIAQDPEGRYFWDLPGGNIRRGVNIKEFITEKLQQEVPNLEIPNTGVKLFMPPTSSLQAVTLGKQIKNHDVLFIGMAIPVSADFEPKITEHLGVRWITKEEFSSLLHGDGTLDNPTLNPWLKNLAEAHFEGKEVPFSY